MSVLDGLRRVIEGMVRVQEPNVVPSTSRIDIGFGAKSLRRIGPQELQQVYRSKVAMLMQYRASNFAPHLKNLTVERRIGDEQDDWEPVERDHPWVRLIRRPNDYMPALLFWKWVVLARDGLGHADMLVQEGTVETEEFGEVPVPVKALHPVYPDYGRMEPMHDTEGDLQGWMFHRSDGKKFPLEAEDVIRVKRQHPNAPWRTAGLVEAAAYEIDQDTAANIYSRDSLRSQGVPDVVLESPEEMNKPKVQKLARRFAKLYGAGRDKVPVAHGGMEVKELSLSQKDQEFSKQREFIAQTLHKIFETHEGLFSKDATRANAEAALFSFAANTVKPNVESITGQFEFEMERVFEADRDQIRISLPADIIPEDRETVEKIRDMKIKNGTLLINEARQDDGRDEVEFGDEPLVNGTLMPLSALGEGF